jgi:competence ComEA-like helix-hairpin-helix protein
MKYFSVGQQWVLFVIALLLLGSLYFKFFYQPPSRSSEEFAKEVVVEVSGEVHNPGVYLFKNPPTLREAIERAGGLKETAQFEATSSSEILETGALLTVVKESSQIDRSPPHPSPLPPVVATRTRGEREKSEGPLRKEEHKGMTHGEVKISISRMAANKLLVFSIPLNLNQVSKEDLCLIPGIGEDLAREMIAYRERRRGFRFVEELRNVKGIGKSKYQSFKTFFIVKHEGAPRELL